MNFTLTERPLGAAAETFLRQHGWNAADPVVRAVATAIDDWEMIDDHWFCTAVSRLRCSPGGYLWHLYRQSGRLMAYDLDPARLENTAA